MPVTVTMPQLGETVTEGTILAWLKQPGDHIDEDEVLLEISTDKVDTEVPSPASGVLQEILVPEGETVGVGTPLAVIAESGEASTAPTEAAPAEAAPVVTGPTGVAPAEAAPVVTGPTGVAPAETAPAAPAPAGTAPPRPAGARSMLLSPVVRRLAAEHGIDLETVTGTGEGGRITRKDIERVIESGTVAPQIEVTVEPAPAAPAEAPEPTATTAPPPTPSAPAAVRSAEAPPAPTAPPPPAAPAAPASAPSSTPAGIPLLPGDEVVDLSRLRKRIAENLVETKRTTAHVWTSVEVDYENVERIRQAHKAEWKQREGFSLTYLPFIARATVDALKAFPAVNSSFYLERGVQVLHSVVNLGIAVDLDQQGLVVVTVPNADGLTLKGLAREIRAKAGKAREGRLEPDDISGSTFSITNPGPFGSFTSVPILNLPNVAILSTDTVVKRPTVVEGPDGTDAIAIHHIGILGLTWDHRAFDGSTAVLFLRRIKETIETWDWEQELA